MGSSSSKKADWRALLALSARESGLLVCASILLPLTRLSLRLFGYRRVERCLSRVFPLRASDADEDRTAYTTARMVSVAAGRSPITANCLPRSLVLGSLLRLQGVDNVLRQGFRKDAGEFAAHAWVEHRGVPLNDTGDVGELFEVVDLPLT